MTDLMIKEGLIRLPREKGDPPRLFGSRCTLCGYCCFPPKPVCPKCLCDDCMEEIKMGPRAVLETFAVMQVGPPDIPTPYIMAYVKTAEGALVFTLVTGCEAREEALELGQEMEMVIEKVKEDVRGNNLIAWKFKPVEGGRS